MADSKITALTAISAVAGEDLVAIVDDPSGTPASKKATITQLVTFLDSVAQTLTNKQIVATQLTGIIADARMPNLTGAITTVEGAVATTLASGLTITTPTITSPSISYAINAQTGTTYTSVLTDAGKIITTSNGSAITFTIPPNSSVAYPIGSSLTVISIGAGLTTFAQGSGVTIASTGATATAPIMRIQHSSATAIKIGTDLWQVVGDIS